MDRQMTLLAVGLYAIACAVLFGTWVGLVYWGEKLSNTPELIHHIQTMLALIAGHVFTLLGIKGMGEQSVPAGTVAQGGFARVGMLLVLSVFVAVALVGCAGAQQVIAGYEKAAVQGLQAAEDNNIAVWRFNACATPLSAMMRNPDLIPGLRALCLQSGAESSPALLFDMPVKK